jgi:peptide chain release factor 1
MEKSMYQRLESAERRLKEIDEELMDEKVVRDITHFREISKERATLDPQVAAFLQYKKTLSDLDDANEMVHDNDIDISTMGKEEVKRLENSLVEIEEQLKQLLLPKDPNDEKDIIVEIRGAVGGDEANIFAGDLFRMYTRYAESQNWKIKMLDESPSEAGGFSIVSFKISGKNVYSKMKFESGAHRVQRVPKTEAGGRIHTSTATVLVMPEAEEIDVQINPNDLQVDTYHSQGAGGQNVNKTESAVRITHLPTGIVVACQTEKSQIQNREIAMQMLRTKMYSAALAEQQEKIGSERKLKVGTGERSEKIRTYNYPQNRVTDHRIGFTIQKLDRVMEGDIEEVIEALIHFDQSSKLASE